MNLSDSLHYEYYNFFWQIAEEENLEADSKFRALVAIGSLVFSNYDDTYISFYNIFGNPFPGIASNYFSFDLFTRNRASAENFAPESIA